MIACYAWTDIQIINITNVRLCDYKDEDADLFVLMLGRINTKLLDVLESANFYSHIYRVPIIEMDLGGKVKNFIPYYKKFYALLHVLEMKKFYAKYYKKMLSARIYSKGLVPGFWGEAIHLLIYLYKMNPNLCVAFIEEGSGHYSSTREMLCRVQMRNDIRQLIFKAILVGRYFRKIDNLSNTLYLYEPQCYEGSADLVLAPIRKINQKDKVYLEWLRQVYNEEVYDEYLKKKYVYFLTDRHVHYVNEQNETKEIFRVLSKIVDVNNIVVKPHPNELRTSLEIQQQYNMNFDVDMKNIAFELVLANVNANEKVFIARGTSCLLTAKYIYNYEPIIIFTFKLYKNRKKVEDHDMSIYINGLRKTYSNPQRVVVVETINELKYVLSTVNRIKEV